MDRYTVQGQSIVFGMFLAWVVVIGIMHWTGSCFEMGGDHEMVIRVDRR